MDINPENTSDLSKAETQSGFWVQASTESKMTLLGVIGAALIGGFFLLMSNAMSTKDSIDDSANERTKAAPQTQQQNSSKKPHAIDEKEYLLEGYNPAKIMNILYSRSDSSDRKYMELEYEKKYIPLSGWTAKITEKSTPAESGGHILRAISEGVNLLIFSEEDLRIFQVGDNIKFVGKIHSIDTYESEKWDKIFVTRASVQLYLGEKH